MGSLPAASLAVCKCGLTTWRVTKQRAGSQAARQPGSQAARQPGSQQPGSPTALGPRRPSREPAARASSKGACLLPLRRRRSRGPLSSPGKKGWQSEPVDSALAGRWGGFVVGDVGKCSPGTGERMPLASQRLCSRCAEGVGRASGASPVGALTQHDSCRGKHAFVSIMRGWDTRPPLGYNCSSSELIPDACWGVSLQVALSHSSHWASRVRRRRWHRRANPPRTQSSAQASHRRPASGARDPASQFSVAPVPDVGPASSAFWRLDLSVGEPATEVNEAYEDANAGSEKCKNLAVRPPASGPAAGSGIVNARLPRVENSEAASSAPRRL